MTNKPIALSPLAYQRQQIGTWIKKVLLARGGTPEIRAGFQSSASQHEVVR